jgi:hypothetical protein
MKTLDDVRCYVHNRLLLFRNIHNTVSIDKFEEAYRTASEDQKKQIIILIDNLDHEKLTKLISLIIYESEILENYSVRVLRKLAQKYGILGYNFLPKASLLSEIKIYEQTNNVTRQHGPIKMVESA